MSRWWVRNRPPARIDIGERYLAHLRWDLMNLAAPHINQVYEGKERHSVQAVLDGRGRVDGAITMIGENRLVHLQMLLRELLNGNVPGDIVEAGAWKGGACIYMRACLDVFGDRKRVVYACDAFDDGFPEPDPNFPADADSQLHTREYFHTSQARVRDYCKYYGYADAQLQIVPGYFQQTLPTLPVTDIALLRLDGDLYESNWTPLTVLYDKVSAGGYVVADDYYSIVNTQMAVDDFRRERQIEEPIRKYDWTSCYWKKEARP